MPDSDHVRSPGAIRGYPLQTSANPAATKLPRFVSASALRLSRFGSDVSESWEGLDVGRAAPANPQARGIGLAGAISYIPAAEGCHG